MKASKKLALVVDDNLNNLTLERDLLEVAGFDVIVAEDSATGIALARSHRPDIIVMDVRLPDMRGSEAAKVLRLDPTTQDIPIVFVTASVMGDGREEIRTIPNTGFIGKPINTRTFANEIIEFMTKKKAVILVVDDQQANIDLLEARLAPEGYLILKATGGEEALALLAGNSVDLMLLDVMMPEMDGLEVTRIVRQDEKHRQLPIILITALTEIEDRVKGIDAGCDDFISKPVDKMELLARVRSLLKVKAYHDLLDNYRKELETEVSKRTGELHTALEGLRSASLETIHRLSRAAEYKDENTGAHITRVSRCCAAIARKLGLDDVTVETILYAASMHDVGKIGIPDRILLKPGKLDPMEREIMRKHTAIGSEILKGSKAKFIVMGELIARTHHERWDGSGYPEGLKGIEIPIESRITAVADVFDALTSRRPYKEAFSVEFSLAIIQEGVGTYFDPAVVQAFYSIMDEILAIRREHADEDGQGAETQELKRPHLQELVADRE